MISDIFRPDVKHLAQTVIHIPVRRYTVAHSLALFGSSMLSGLQWQLAKKDVSSRAPIAAMLFFGGVGRKLLKRAAARTAIVSSCACKPLYPVMLPSLDGY